jgi:hypothetical protein
MFLERLRDIFVSNTSCIPDYIALMRRQVMNNDLDTMRKEAAET